MNRFYLFEVLWYLLHRHPRQAMRRWRGRTLAGVSPALSTLVPTWYYTPTAFATAFSPAFRCVRCQALPVLLPPPYLAELWLRHRWLMQRLQPWEEKLAGRWPFNGLGDHFLMVLQRIGP
jgi:hypothetical protein